MRNSKQRKCCQFFFYSAVAVVSVILNGCAPPEIKVPTVVCPGKPTVANSLDALHIYAESAVPLKGNGQCFFLYYDEGEERKESFGVKFWANPPSEIYMQGSVTFKPRVIVVGSNEKEFWLAVKPKEISSYWWGRRSEESGAEKLIINPKILLEAFGIIVPGWHESDEENWDLSNEGVFDILTRYNQQGQIVQKVYIYCCDYRVRKIEYFDTNGEIVAITELDRYKSAGGGFSIPGVLRITIK
ncbi:MAG: hypothetical protein ACYS0I_04585 [Planctomycetota bacterium]|jgi:hypothetical protein